MPTYQLAAALTADRTQLVVEHHMDGEAAMHVLLAAPEASKFLGLLMHLRAAMTEPAGSEMLEAGARLDVTSALAWHVNQGTPGHVLLALRHPGAGWLGFDLERAHAEAIGSALLEWSKK